MRNPDDKSYALVYNPASIAKRMRESGVNSNNEMEVQLLSNEMAFLERNPEEEEMDFITSLINNKTKDGKAKYTDKNRLFIRKHPDEGKLYTNRYVRRLKDTHKRLMDKFTLGSSYALKAQKKQLMVRASRLVLDSHNKLVETFSKEALTILH